MDAGREPGASSVSGPGARGPDTWNGTPFEKVVFAAQKSLAAKLAAAGFECKRFLDLAQPRSRERLLAEELANCSAYGASVDVYLDADDGVVLRAFVGMRGSTAYAYSYYVREEGPLPVNTVPDRLRAVVGEVQELLGLPAAPPTRITPVLLRSKIRIATATAPAPAPATPTTRATPMPGSSVDADRKLCASLQELEEEFWARHEYSVDAEAEYCAAVTDLRHEFVRAAMADTSQQINSQSSVFPSLAILNSYFNALGRPRK